jgi:hypothetical protein
MYLRVCCMFALCGSRIAFRPAFRRKRPSEALQPVLELACRNGSPINWTQPSHGDSISEGRDATWTRCQFAPIFLEFDFYEIPRWKCESDIPPSRRGQPSSWRNGFMADECATDNSLVGSNGELVDCNAAPPLPEQRRRVRPDRINRALPPLRFSLSGRLTLRLL